MPQKPPRYRPPGLSKRPSPSEANRPTTTQRGYGWPWQQFRESYLRDYPLCVDCGKLNITTEATCIDHLDSLGPNGPRGYDPTNLEALCDSCHSKRTIRRTLQSKSRC